MIYAESVLGQVVRRDLVKRIARERDFKTVAVLACRELELLYAELNRTRYCLEAEEEFIRFFLHVRDSLYKCLRASGRLYRQGTYGHPRRVEVRSGL